MTATAKSIGLLRALRHMLPDAELSVIHQRPWHSLTFSGAQICISLVLTGEQHTRRAARFALELPKHEFDLAGQLVADIAVIETACGENQSRLMIDTLLLDE